MKKKVISAVSILTGLALGASVVGKMAKNSFNKMRNASNKHLELFLMMNQWVKIKQNGKSLTSYFEENGYRKIAVYGMSYAGETLLEELKNTSVQVAYGIDQRGDSVYTDIRVVTGEDFLDEVDAIVVTAITFFDTIKEQLSKRIDCPIISLEDILYKI